MNQLVLETVNLRLVLQGPEEILRSIETMPPEMRAEVSLEWVKRLQSSREPDPWIHSFLVLHRENECVVGQCGFKGPPCDGAVEIAYGINDEQRGRGYATEVARCLTEYALTCAGVSTVCAHTLATSEASKRVLLKCGFEYVGEVVDPEDGIVRRYEKRLPTPDSHRA